LEPEIAAMNKRQTRQEAKRQIKKLLAASSPAEREAIHRGRKAGRELRRQLEKESAANG
jgi:hypothetical protein